MSDTVTLREYIERILDEREKHYQLVLSLASSEIERRLKDLNQLREYVVKDRILFVKTESFDIKMKDLDNWKKSVDISLTKISTKSTTWAAALAVAFIIAQLILAYFRI